MSLFLFTWNWTEYRLPQTIDNMAPRTRSQTRSKTCSTEFSNLSLDKPSKGSPKTPEKVTKVSLQRSRSATPTRSSSNNRSPKTLRHNLSARTLTNKTSSELQSLCSLYRVSGKGPKSILTQRLVDVSQKNDNRCHAILVTESKIPGKQATISDAKGALLKALEHEMLLVKDIRGQAFVANEEAVKYAEAKMDMIDIQPRLDDKNDKLSKANNQRNAKDKQIKMLQDRLNHMSRQMDLHEILRNRFISAYKRDELDSKEISDKTAVEKGNEKVHSGDAVLDAHLFQPGGSRDDVDAYKSLYGLTPSEVLDISVLGMYSMPLPSIYVYANISRLSWDSWFDKPECHYCRLQTGHLQ